LVHALPSNFIRPRCLHSTSNTAFIWDTKSQDSPDNGCHTTRPAWITIERAPAVVASGAFIITNGMRISSHGEEE
jgi:hypothetical protein